MGLKLSIFSSPKCKNFLGKQSCVCATVQPSKIIMYTYIMYIYTKK